ncbi:ABC transporter ATP-binding protein [Ensifer adhaerens]|uniref:ABC transporter ATP-binding protein n=1 Tax=Ensifer adhaerens TaxID=106592 RepID=UPI001CC1722E|nr:ABC transporter ATP-binding protein [Ensifer adhaerens]MBZ7924305.1 ABC transporter ATP-binding protein [Ensifer adhaerens]UAX96444.1 ABC transporter ATP-binding protein [Ensifer adhaerens]UAY04213.1 ABC transporter ATP-binding protein [Ensifer adhaerens]UAY12199.1 ABC transporter ATP-binding protein [Ensifer adhaerens]
MTQHLLSVRGLEKSFGAVVAARSIDCDLAEGEVVGVIGSNGAGKTTFVNMITGHLRPTAGRIMFGGTDIAGVPSRLLVGLGISRSFQIAQIFPALTALENVCAAAAVIQSKAKLGAAVRKRFAAPEIATEGRELLEAFGIDQYQNSPAGELAQGVRKILDIAMACASRPRLLLLDEPTAGVSLDERDGLMQQAVSALKSRGTTIVFVEHDMDIVRSYSDRVLAFYDGQIIGDGTAADVLSREKIREFIIGSSKRTACA